jgi:HAE1 family hydrophobic/amphiphilic exporter-1
MAGLRALADVETTQRPGAPEVQIVYDRDQLSRYGLNIQTVARQVRDAVKGYEATLYNLGDRRIPIVVRLQEDDRRRVTDVREFLVNPGGERPIPLASVAEVTLAEGPSEVRRVDGRRVALVQANVGRGSLGGAVEQVERALSTRVEWPSDMTFYVAGQSQEWNRSQGSLLLALALSVFLVYVIMAAQFESLAQPLVIMLTIPLAFLGTVVTLWVLSISLSVVVFLGMIMLAGIVVNNAIVLVDYINTLRQRGMERAEAIVTAGSVRLRPILMTTATTALGLTPMALGLGDGAEIRTPMAIAVISGLLASTVLTLLLIPSVYSMIDRVREAALGPSPATTPGAEAEGAAS